MPHHPGISYCFKAMSSCIFSQRANSDVAMIIFQDDIKSTKRDKEIDLGLLYQRLSVLGREVLSLSPKANGQGMYPYYCILRVTRIDKEESQTHKSSAWGGFECRKDQAWVCSAR